MPLHKRQRARQLPRAPRHVHPKPQPKRRAHQPRAQQQVPARERRRQQVIRRHHLRARVRLKRLKDVILRAIRQAIKQQVHRQQQHAPRRLPAVARRLLPPGARVQRKHRHPRRDRRDDAVLVQRVALAEHGDVQQHDGEELAALGEDVGDVVDVGEGGVAEGGGEGVGKGDEEERGEDAAVGDHARDGAAARRAEVGEEQAADAGEEGLDRQEEDGELEALAGGAVFGRCELLLEVGPCEAAERGGGVSLESRRGNGGEGGRAGTNKEA